jgi:hypothetical protein
METKMLGEYTKTTIADYIQKIKWVPCEKPQDTDRIVIDLQSLYFTCLGEYIHDEDSSYMNMVYDYIKDNIYTILFMRMASKISSLKKSFNLIVIGKEKCNYDNSTKPNIKNCSLKDIQDVRHFKNTIISYLFANESVYENLQYIVERSGINILYSKDKSIECAVQKYPVISTDAHVLMFGKDELYKYANNEWFKKTKSDFMNTLKFKNDKEFMYFCILLGTKYAKRSEKIRIGSIRKISDKRSAMAKMLIDSGNQEILDFINKRVF